MIKREVKELLATMEVKRIRLVAEGANLRFQAPAGMMTPALRAELAQHKAALLEILRQGQEFGASMGAAEGVAPAGTAAVSETETCIPVVDRSDGLPLSHEERRLWLLHHQLAKPAAYNVSWALRLRGSIDLARLRSAYAAVMARHEILRSAYTEQDGEPLRLIYRELPVPLLLDALPAGNDLAGESELFQRITKEIERPFDLTRAPLFRIQVLNVGPDDHVVVTTVHHIIFDEWSTGLLQEEVSTFYSAGEKAAAEKLMPLPIQYADYAAWQSRRVMGTGMARHRAYWRKTLQGVRLEIDLPADRPLPSKSSGAGGLLRFMVPPTVVDSMEALGRKEAATSFVVWLAAFSVWLSRVTGQRDLVIATPFTQRRQPEVQNLIGFFLNTLPIRISLSPENDFRAVIRSTRARVLDGFEYGALPLGEIVSECALSRPTGVPGLFPVMFVHQRQAERSHELPGTTSRAIELEHSSAKVPLTFFFRHQPDGTLAGAIEFSTEVFDRASIERMAGQFNCLAESLARFPDAPVVTAELLPEHQRRQVVQDFNPSTVDYPRKATVAELFRDQCRETPDAVALVLGDRSITYAELEKRADAVTRRLRDAGTRQGDFVGILLDRSVGFVVAALGVLKAGAAYVPLNRDFPGQRLAYILNDCRTRTLITHGQPSEEIEGLDLTVLDLAGDAVIMDCSTSIEHVVRSLQPARRSAGAKIEQRDEAPEDSTADSPAYVMYTSGSTGQPKGVVIPHRGIIRLVRSQTYASFARSERFMFLASPAFDASTFEIWGPLLNGAACVVYPEKWPDFERLESAIRDSGVSCLWLTAGLFNQIVDQHPEMLGSVSQVITGGEALSVPHVKRALQLLPQLRLTNGYGPTESTTFACTYEVPDQGQSLNGSVPIGRPLAHTRCYILDEQLQPVPVGVAGELYLGGDGLAREYLHCPELTQERFIHDPFNRNTGARLYRTGDRCRLRSDGLIEFLGRLDDQIKLRGFRIELGEIENVLATHPEIAQAAVAVRDDGHATRMLCAYYVSRNGGAVSGEILRDWLGQRIPDHMIPSQVSCVERLPLNANGKVDRRALLAATSELLDTVVSQVEPRTGAERVLADIWQQVLKREKVGIHDNFFEIGGSSLLAMRLVDEIRRRFHLPFPLAGLFAAPTIERLAQRLTDKQPGDSGEVPVVMRGTGPGTPLFFIPGIAGYEFMPRALVERLRGDRPFFDGLQMRGVDGHHLPADRVEVIAADLIEQIRRVQRAGPYCLSGFCFGGLVAFEIARQLELAGQTVKGVVTWDTFPQRGWLHRMADKVARVVDSRLAIVSSDRIRRFLRSEIRRTSRQATRVFQPQTMPGPAKQEHLSATTREVIKACYRAIEAYRPKPYHGRVLLVYGRTQAYDPWKGILRGRVETVDLACKHTDFLKDEAVINEAAVQTAAFLRSTEGETDLTSLHHSGPV